MSVNDKKINQILNSRYTLPNGTLAKVFVKNKKFSALYDCLLCSVQMMGANNLIQHATGRRHNEKADLVDVQTVSLATATPDREDRQHRNDNISSENFTSSSRRWKSPERVLNRNEGDPSHKAERKTSTLQSVIDQIKDISIVGLEFILDVQSNSESSYHCVLCQQIFDRISDVVEHLTSYDHRLHYLDKFFPKVFDEVSYLIEIVCAGIENQYSRSNLIVLEKREFLENRDKLTRLGSNSKYINDNIGCSELIQTSADAVEGDLRCVDVISISSDTSSDDGTDRNTKLESFRVQMATAKTELMNTYRLYNTNPCSHPGYYQMWVTFWNTHITEFRVGNKFNTAYDWKSEWASEWKKIMNEKMKMDLEAKSSEIRKQLQITDAMLSEIEKNLTQIPEIVVDTEKLVVSQSTQRPISPKQCSFKNSNSDRNNSAAIEQKTSTEFSSKCPEPIGLEQLLQKHKHSGDFLISWRELLHIFGIEDNPNSNEIEHIPPTPQTNQDPNDHSKKQVDCVDVYRKIVALPEHPVETLEQVTVISVLSLLLALENMLGSLAPKVIDLLQTAIAMERLKADSSYTLLNDSNNCILFETIKEKFKGLVTADLVAENVQSVVRKAINDMTDLVQQSNESPKNRYVLPSFNRSVEETPPQAQTFVYVEPSLPATANEFENIASADEAVTLKDSEIKVLMTKFRLLPQKEKTNFTAYLNKLRTSDPNRLMQLKNDICQNQPLNQTSFLEWEREMNYPDEVFYSDSTNYTENALNSDYHDKTTSIAYQLAQRNAGVKIKRRWPAEGDDFAMEKRFYQG